MLFGANMGGWGADWCGGGCGKGGGSDEGGDGMLSYDIREDLCPLTWNLTGAQF